MITQKLKICKGCNKPKKIFSKGFCIDCSKTHFKPIRRTKIKNRGLVHLRERSLNLSQEDAFKKAYLFWGGKNYLTGEKMNLNELGAENFHHVLSKGRFKYFKYYHKSIVILSFDQHYVITHGTLEDMEVRGKDHVEENWNRLFEYEKELKSEYKEWIKEHKGEYKL